MSIHTESQALMVSPFFNSIAGKKAEASEAEPMDDASDGAAPKEWETAVLVLSLA